MTAHRQSRRAQAKAARQAARADDQVTWPQVPATKPTKAYVAAVVTILGLVGIQVTTGTAQVIVMVLQLVLVVYGVWRAYNRPKLPDRGRRVGGQL